jgi:methanogenic corrinoid protein MtbC1
MSDEEIILSELSDDELVQQMHDDLYDGLKEEIEEGTNILLESRLDALRRPDRSSGRRHAIVGEDFRDGILFVPEVLMSANAMKAGMFILRRCCAETGAPQARQDGHRHRQGRHSRHRQEPCRMMMEGAGFDVIDLASTTRSKTISRPSKSNSPTFSACRRC